MTRIAFSSTPFAVRDALKQARAIWQSGGVAREICDIGEQVLAEALNNVVEHAHKESPEGMVWLDTTCQDGGIICAVQDDGLPMPGLRLPEGRLSELSDDLQYLPEGGFGWFMIRDLTHDLSYERKNGNNILRFRIAAPSSDASDQTQ